MSIVLLAATHPMRLRTSKTRPTPFLAGCYNLRIKQEFCSIIFASLYVYGYDFCRLMQCVDAAFAVATWLCVRHADVSCPNNLSNHYAT